MKPKYTLAGEGLKGALKILNDSTSLREQIDDAVQALNYWMDLISKKPNLIKPEEQHLKIEAEYALAKFSQIESNLESPRNETSKLYEPINPEKIFKPSNQDHRTHTRSGYEAEERKRESE